VLLVLGNACRQTVEPIGLAPAPQISGFTLVEATTGSAIELLADGQTVDLALLPTRDLAMTVAFSGEGDAVLISYDGSQRLERCSPYSILADDRGHFDCWDPPLGGTGVHTVTARPSRRCGTGAIWGDTRSLTFTVTDSGSGTAFSCGTRTEPLGPTCDTSSAYPAPRRAHLRRIHDAG
jgi:hypothetical protein